MSLEAESTGRLCQTCPKAGPPPDAWKRPDAEIYSFEAEVFGER